MMSKFLILFVLLSNFVLAQEVDQLDKEYERLKLMLEQNQSWIKSQQQIKDQTEFVIKKNQAEIKSLDDLIRSRTEYKKQVLDEIEKEIKNVPGIVRMVSKKAAYYRCLQENLNLDKSEFFQTCHLKHLKKLSKSEESDVNRWMALTDLSPYDLKSKVQKLEFAIEVEQSTHKLAAERIQTAFVQRERLIEDEEKILMKYEDRKVAAQNSHFVKCDANTPDISLEEETPYPGAKFKGPFYKVPRDNQDGIGSCYANTAKNLLVGTSRGSDIASFLDLALLYKEESGVIASGLDGGFTCHVLAKLKNHGYCPQGLAPIETGEANFYNDAWLGSDRIGLWGQSVVFEYLQKFPKSSFQGAGCDK